MDNKKIQNDELRKKAKKLLKSRNNHISQHKDVDEVIHELEVHQIELELQNEELREAQIKLDDSKLEYFDLYNLAPVGYYTLDTNGIILKVNLRGAAFLGVERANLHKTAFIQYIDPNCRNKFHNIVKKVMKTGTKQTIELKLHQKDSGEKWWGNCSIGPINQNDKLVGLNVVVQDITKRKKAEETLIETLKNTSQLNRTLVALRHSSYAMMHATDEESYMDELCKIIVDYCGYSMVWIGFTEKESKKVRPVAYAGFEEDYLKELNITWDDTERGHGPTGTVIRTGKLYICENMLTDPKFKPWREEALKRGYASSIVLPIVNDNNVLGALNIYSKETNPFSEEGKNLLEEVVGDMSYGITSLRLKMAHDEAEKALRESELKFREIIETANEGILVEDTRSIITFANSKMTDMLGYSIEELIGTDARFFVDKNDLEKAEEKFEERKTGIKDEYQLKFCRKNGEPLYTLAKASPIYNYDGTYTNTLVMYTDITERVADDEKLESLMVELKRSNNELEQFAYIASHDLREPLRMISSFLQLLERRYKDKLDEDANDFIGFAVDGAKRLDDMIKDLLEYSQVMRKEIEFIPVKLEVVLEETLINLVVQTEENNATITYDSLPSVMGDEKLLVKLFQNLIGNAIKYRSQETPQIHINVKEEKNQYLFSVKDNGIGIDSEHLNRIFTIFQRLHTNEKYEGTGIGLAIVQKIVHQHGGQIWAESELGKGTTFYFILPINAKN